jgi:hypothetical protein
VVETTGHEHVHELHRALADAGVHIETQPERPATAAL